MCELHPTSLGKAGGEGRTPFYENLGKRLFKSPKVYLADSGLACHLLGIETASELERSPFLDALFEGFIAAEIAKGQVNAGRRRDVSGPPGAESRVADAGHFPPACALCRGSASSMNFTFLDGNVRERHPIHMRRKDKEVTDPSIIQELLSTAEVCRVAMVDEGGEPYIVPLNYGYRDNALYVHSAAVGRKIDLLKRNNRVCFEVESASSIIRHEEPCHWSTRSRSIVGYGHVEILTDHEEKKRGLDIILTHYGKVGPNVYDEKHLRAVVILRISIESVSCKQLGDWSEREP